VAAVVPLAPLVKPDKVPPLFPVLMMLHLH
jgi:hypothetical protein